MIPPAIEASLRRRFAVQEFRRLPPGMSGADLFACRGETSLALRRWSAATSIARVDEIHRVIGPAAERCPLLPRLIVIQPPDQTRWIDARNRIWDVMTWVPGSPTDYRASAEMIRRGGEAIAKVHQALAEAGGWCVSTDLTGTDGGGPVAAAVRERIERLQWLDRVLVSGLLSGGGGRAVAPELRTQLDRARDCLRRRWTIASVHLANQLGKLSSSPHLLHYVLRDIHREHALFTGRKVTGIIDFDAVRVDTPAVDLSRWASSFACYAEDPNAAIDATLAGYFQKRAFPKGHPTPERIGRDDYHEVVRVLADATGWISLANWVVWLEHQCRQFPGPVRVARRIAQLTDRADAWTAAD